MLVIWLFQLGLARADVNLSFLIPAGEFNYQTSPEDDKKAREIAKRVTERQNKCFDHLDTSYQTLCVNLDVEKRINLSAATLYCEHQLDRRSDKLPYLDENPNLRNYSAFVRSLDDDTFALFTNLFISVDSICFHATHEAQSTANINTMESIFRASEIAAVYIKDSSAKLRNITKDVVKKLGDVYDAMTETESKITTFQERVVGVIERFNKLTERARYYKGAITNVKLYLVGIGVELIMNLVVRNVLTPSVAITALFLLIESHLHMYGSTVQVVLKWSYVLSILGINGFAIWCMIAEPTVPQMRPKKAPLAISPAVALSI